MAAVWEIWRQRRRVSILYATDSPKALGAACNFGRVVGDSDGFAVTAEIGKMVRMHKVSLVEP